MKFLFERIYLPLVLSLLSACSTVPEVLEQKPVEPLSLYQVQSYPDVYLGKRIRWGGRILQVKNEEKVTWMQVLAVPLDSSQRPYEDADGIGRFMIRSNDFLDPAIYAVEREVTVVGTINGTKEKLIDKRKVRLVVVDADIIYLWPKRSEYNNLYYYPYYPYYPYYYPYWPYYY